MLLPVTIASAAAIAIVNFWLAVRIIRLRFKNEVVHGDGGNALLLRRMRAQSNFIEYAPIILILCALIEMAQGGAMWLQIVMAAFVIGRIAHGIGMDSEKPTAPRGIGMMTTFATMLVLIGAALYMLYGAMPAA